MATITKFADAGGDEMKVLSYNDHLFPWLPKNAIPEMPSVKTRSDDIIITAYPKSGTHWLHEITRLLVSGSLEKVKTSKEGGWFEVQGESILKELPSPRILSSHSVFGLLPSDIKETKPKILYIIRNPKDTIVSYFNFISKIPFMEYKGKWENFLKSSVEKKFIYGSWFDYVKDWEEVKKATDIPILTLTYESLKEDPLSEIKKINEFLGTGRDEEFLKGVVEASSFDSMKSTKQHGAMVYRKGQKGDWKNWFTEEQSKWFDQLYQEKMKDFPVTVKFT